MTAPVCTPVSAGVRRITVAAVLVVACVAAVVSYAHMQHVAHRAGEAWRSFLLPLSVDGLMVAASMVLLARRRAGLPGGALAWTALLAGVGASLAANVAAAEPSTTARVVAAWPAVAFAVAFELLLQQRRPAVTEPAPDAVGRRSELRYALPDVERAAAVGSPPTDRASTPGAPGAGVALATRAREVIAQAGGRPPGRRVLARQLGCTEHRARTLLDALSPNGSHAPDGGAQR